jgi:SAM-dependent methyltransferase
MPERPKDAAATLEFYHQQWTKKPILRKLYCQWYARIFASLRKRGTVLELGSGSGMGKEFHPCLLLGDIVHTRWVDIVLAGEKLPVRDCSLANIIMIDTLHHLNHPVSFLKEASRALSDGGRIVAVEPYTRYFAYFFWRCFHHEPVDLGIDLCAHRSTEKKPFDANQAIPSLIIKEFDRIHPMVPDLAIVRVDYFDLFYYALSGGFSKPNLLPPRLEPLALFCDRVLLRLWGQYLALRIMVVLEKVCVHDNS